MIPFAVLLCWRDYATDSFVLKDTVTPTAAALIGMMPQGLILLTTVALVVGVIKLAKKKTLVRELYCIEALSRVSLLCLDKTGTITTGAMTVDEVLPLSRAVDEADRRSLIATALAAIDDRNATAKAMNAYYAPFVDRERFVIDAVTPFSSERKRSAAVVRGVGTVVFGAYDRLLAGEPPAEWTTREQQGKRLILVAFSRAESIDEALCSLEPLEAVVLSDELRDNAADILRFFKEEGVAIRVLSGDHPQTVCAIAKKAGLDGWDLAVDATTLRTPEELEQAAKTYVVFGRVSPAQKKALVTLFKQQGHTVAMTGDGVNDGPALKEADCSVAMAAGSDAAKQVSQIVLLDSDFEALPTVVMEGRRVVNNITRTASLFLVKTIMSFLVTLSAIALPMAYPFEPLQLTLIGIFAESVPGFFLTLEPCRERIRGSFMHTVLKNAFPSALLIALSVVAIQLWLAPVSALSAEQASTLCVYVTGLIWLIQLFRVCRPLTAPRVLLWALMTIGFFAGALLLANVLPTVFALLGFEMETVFVLPTTPMLLITALAAVIMIPLDRLLFSVCGRVWKKAM
ncbi:MAG: HAD-IC family P-type ATPase, partial [Clostridia bacterium]|nr:HAD-IC family P-type ATPase [Clostridia bacterium]